MGGGPTTNDGIQKAEKGDPIYIVRELRRISTKCFSRRAPTTKKGKEKEGHLQQVRGR